MLQFLNNGGGGSINVYYSYLFVYGFGCSDGELTYLCKISWIILLSYLHIIVAQIIIGVQETTNYVVYDQKATGVDLIMLYIFILYFLHTIIHWRLLNRQECLAPDNT